MVVASDWGTGQVFLEIFYFFMFFIWIYLLIVVFGDIFRSHDMSGWAKAAWVIFVIILPFLGIFVYLIARGNKMSEHAQEAAQAQHAAFTQAVQQAAGTTTSTADQLAQLADLKANGTITDSEFEQAKAKALSS